MMLAWEIEGLYIIMSCTHQDHSHETPCKSRLMIQKDRRKRVKATFTSSKAEYSMSDDY